MLVFSAPGGLPGWARSFHPWNLSLAEEARLIVQISDLHLGYEGAHLSPERALQQAVEEITAMRPVPAAVLMSGDLTHNGRPQEYQRLRDLLAPLTMPIHPMMGNHDHREAFGESFRDHPGVAASRPRGLVNYGVDCGGLKLICLDTCVEGSDAGWVGSEQRSWLAGELGRADGRPTLVAMHHPPIATGMDEFDRISLTLDERQALATLVGGFSGVEMVVCGHIHRVISGRLGVVPTLICPSVFMQAELNLLPQAALRLAPGGRGMAIHIYRPGQPLLTHIHFLEGGRSVGRSSNRARGVDPVGPNLRE